MNVNAAVPFRDRRFLFPGRRLSARKSSSSFCPALPISSFPVHVLRSRSRAHKPDTSLFATLSLLIPRCFGGNHRMLPLCQPLQRSIRTGCEHGNKLAGFIVRILGEHQQGGVETTPIHALSSPQEIQDVGVVPILFTYPRHDD